MINVDLPPIAIGDGAVWLSAFYSFCFEFTVKRLTPVRPRRIEKPGTPFRSEPVRLLPTPEAYARVRALWLWSREVFETRILNVDFLTPRWSG